MRVKELIRLATKARRHYGIGRGQSAVFGHCAAVSTHLKRLIEEAMDYSVRIRGGLFVCDLNEPYLGIHHTWLDVEGHILDATVDQFFPDMPFSVALIAEGIYFAHPRQDHGLLRKHYGPSLF